MASPLANGASVVMSVIGVLFSLLTLLGGVVTAQAFIERLQNGRGIMFCRCRVPDYRHQLPAPWSPLCRSLLGRSCVASSDCWSANLLTAATAVTPRR